MTSNLLCVAEKIGSVNWPDIFIFTPLLDKKTKIQSVRILTIITPIVLFFVIGCGNPKNAQLPPAPSGSDAIIKTVKGKKYKTTDLALISKLAADKNNPYEWFEDVKDTTAFFRNYEKQRKTLEINFLNDTTAEITDEAGTNKATWKIDDQPKSDETPGQFLRLSMEKDEELISGQVGKSTITFSYKVLGIDDKQLFLETPNMFNMRKVAALMTAD